MYSPSRSPLPPLSPPNPSGYVFLKLTSLFIILYGYFNSGLSSNSLFLSSGVSNLLFNLFIKYLILIIIFSYKIFILSFAFAFVWTKFSILFLNFLSIKIIVILKSFFSHFHFCFFYVIVSIVWFFFSWLLVSSCTFCTLYENGFEARYSSFHSFVLGTSSWVRGRWL